MGVNSYLAEAASFGYKTSTTLAMVHNIEPKAGKRIVIIGFSASAGSADEIVYFMNPTRGVLDVAMLSGGTTVYLADTALDPSGNEIAASDFVCLELDDGSYLWTTVSSWSSTNAAAVLAAAASASAAIGKALWNFGVVADDGHFPYAVATDTTVAKESDSGIFYAPNKAYPMKAYLISTTDVACSWAYITVAYIKQ